MKKKQHLLRLTQAILASSIFASNVIYASCDINSHTTTTVDTSTCTTGPDVNIFPSGDIQTGAADAIDVTSPTSNITIFPNNHVGANAILTTTGIGINFIPATDSANITVGANSGITVGNANAIAQGNIVNIDNEGTIQNNSTTKATIETPQSGSILNESGGIMQNLSNIGGSPNYVIDVALLVTPYIGDIENEAGAQIISAAGTTAINVGNNIVGAIINDGTIQAAGLTGSGAAILANNNVGITITKGIINHGDIINLSGGRVIDVGTNGENNVTVIQDVGGSTTGSIILAQHGSGGVADQNVFFMKTGTGVVNGSVTAANKSQNILQLDGGTITGLLNLGSQGDTVNLTGTNILGTIATNDPLGLGAKINVTGGNFGTLQGVATPLTNPFDTLNVNATFTTSAKIDSIPIINVNNSGTVFTSNGNITNVGTTPVLGQITINPGTSMIANGQVTGDAKTGFSLLNNGFLLDNSPSPFFFNTVTGNTTNNANLQVNVSSKLITNQFMQSSTGNYAVQLQDTSKSGLIDVTKVIANAATLAAGSTIEPIFLPGFIPNGTKFDILRVNAGATLSDLSTLKFSSALIRVEKSGPTGTACTVVNPAIPNSTCIELTVFNTPISSVVVNNQQVLCLARTLATQVNSANPFFVNLFGELQALQTNQQVTDALDTLVPLANNTLPSLSRWTTNANLDSVEERLFMVRGYRTAKKHRIHRDNEHLVVNPSIPDEIMEEEQGYGFGDFEDLPWSYAHWGVWGRGYGSYLNQNDRKHMEGYHAKVYGIVMGSDWGILEDCITIGVAGSYAHGFAKGKTFANKELEVNSYQATAYIWMEPWPNVYWDAMLLATEHKYDTIRNVDINSTIFGEAKGSFHGFQYGVQTDLSYMWTFEGYYITPMARIKATHLGLEDYVEDGSAGAFNLHIHQSDMSELVGGIGIRLDGSIAEMRRLYEPEISLMANYDFFRDKERMQVNFLAGGPEFCANSIKPSPASVVLGVGFNTYSGQYTLFNIKYELEWRKQFFGHTAYIQFNYEFA